MKTSKKKTHIFLAGLLCVIIGFISVVTMYYRYTHLFGVSWQAYEAVSLHYKEKIYAIDWNKKSVQTALRKIEKSLYKNRAEIVGTFIPALQKEDIVQWTQNSDELEKDGVYISFQLKDWTDVRIPSRRMGIMRNCDSILLSFDSEVMVYWHDKETGLFYAFRYFGISKEEIELEGVKQLIR